MTTDLTTALAEFTAATTQLAEEVAALAATVPPGPTADDLVAAWEAWFTAAAEDFGGTEGLWGSRLAVVARSWQHDGHWPHALRGWQQAGPLPERPPQDVIDAATERILARIEQENAPKPEPFPPIELPLTVGCIVDDTDSIRLLWCDDSLSLQLNITADSAAGPFARSVVLDDNDARLLAHAILEQLER